MKIPFTIQQFLDVFKNYNETVFPAQIIFYLASFFILFLLFKGVKNAGKIISAILAFYWLWIGIVYHLIFFSSINTAAYIFGILFIIQGILFIVYGVLNNQFSFNYKKDKYSFVAAILLLYALLIYPILGHILGHQYPYSPTFGLPCPTTIFTFGILLFNSKRIQVPVLIIPFLWSLLGFSAALQLSIYEDFGLLVAGLTATILLLVKNKKLELSDKSI